ncbi:hypothetical protein IWX78_001954 [Mycetocola sp. CAN_C7]|uniref:hypothetical protein n=1 Tax=Mycetocola sp. CAN_C7 TaxID=2787724 RepID=UPI0018CB7D9E
MSTLADELRQPAAPSTFRVLLPPGWAQHQPNEEGRQKLAESIRARFKQAGRPDLDVKLSFMLNRQWTALGRMGAVALYLPTEDTEVPMPMTVVAVPYTVKAGETLDADVRKRARGPVETYDLPFSRVYRWIETQNNVNSEAGASARSISYLYPVPGRNPTRGMLLATSILHLQSGESDEMLESLTTLSDAIAETFRWK